MFYCRRCVPLLPRIALISLLTALALVVAFLLAWLGLRLRMARKRVEGDPSSDGLDTVAAWSPQATRALTNAERDAYETLRKALPTHIVLAQVPLARFIRVPTRNSYAEWLRRAGQLCADLVICDRHSQVIAVVEIHSSKEQVNPRALKRQQRLARVLRAAGVTVHIWPETALPSVEAARKALALAPSLSDEPAEPAAAMRTTPQQRLRSGSDSDWLAEGEHEEPAETSQARPSTWFDEFESSHAPLPPESAKTASR